eukprot:1760663-Pleurochrysis_carterae.AAC.1
MRCTIYSTGALVTTYCTDPSFTPMYTALGITLVQGSAVCRVPCLSLPASFHHAQNPLLPSLSMPPVPPLTLGPAPPFPCPPLPCCHACMRTLLSSSIARSLSLMRVSCFRRQHGKNLHFVRMKRQFPRWGRKSRHMICDLKAFSSARSATRSPSPPFAAASHAMSTASSCACDVRTFVSTRFFAFAPSPFSLTINSCVAHLLLSLHIQSVFWLCGLQLGSRRCGLSLSSGNELVGAPFLLSAILPQSFAVFAVRACAQLAPPRCLVEYEGPSHRMVCACCVCFWFERTFVVVCVKSEARGSPLELFPRWCGIPEFTLVCRRAGAHPPHADVQLLYGIDHDSPEILPFILRASVLQFLPRLPKYFLDLPSHEFVSFRGRDIEEPPRHRW